MRYEQFCIAQSLSIPYQQTASFYIGQVQNILMKLIYQFFFGTFFEYQGTQFLDNVICHSYEILKWMLLNRGISIFWQTLLGIQTSLHQMQILFTYLESDKNVTLKWRNCLTLHLMIAFTSHVYLTLDTKQSDQETNLLLILLKGKIHMIMI